MVISVDYTDNRKTDPADEGHNSEDLEILANLPPPVHRLRLTGHGVDYLSPEEIDNLKVILDANPNIRSLVVLTEGGYANVTRDS